MLPLRVSANVPAADMNIYSGVMSGLVIYLCLWKSVSYICVALVSSIQNIHER